MRLRGDHAHHRERAVIQRQIDHLLRLVEDLLDVSRITRGTVALRRGRVDLARVVALAIEEASPLIELRRHELVVDVPDGLAVDGDETRLTQVVTNLITNAAKYTDPRGKLEIAATREDGEVALRVKDSGVGVRAELLRSIFDPFVQEQQTPERARGGLGLGLAIVKSLVELHGGTVSAHSDGPGQGTEMRIRLPAARAAAPVAAVADDASVPHALLDGVRVLIVDDNNDAADLLAEFLQAAGCRTAVAYDGPTALRAARSMGPSVALLDLGLPIMDGYEVARLLRALPGHAALRLVAITGYGQASDRARTHAAGFDAHLVKPIAPDEVTRVIANLVTRAARARPRPRDPRTGQA
jgi:CheY-like chemotaxis protein